MRHRSHRSPHHRSLDRVGLLVAGSLALIVAACSAEPDVAVVGQAQPGPGEQRRFVVAARVQNGCDQVAAAYCAALARCNPHWLAVDFADEADCTARMALGCSRNAAAPGAAGLVDDLGACLDPLATSCATLIPGTLPTCGFRPGAAAAGAACAVDGQCASLRCNLDAAGCGVCAKTAAVADACGGGPCPDEARVEGADCSEGGCAHALGLHCHGPTKRCRSIPMRPAGEGCDMTGIMTGALSECRQGACRNQNDMGAGHCLAFAADGAECGGWDGPRCQPPARCIAGRCAVPPVLCPGGG